MAIVGCAVTEWALRPLPQGESQGGLFGEMNELLQAQSPALQDKMMELGVNQYLAKYVKPLAKDVAQALAHDLFRLVCHFLPATFQENGSQWSPSISEEQTNQNSVRSIAETKDAASEVTGTPSSSAPSAQVESETSSRRSLRQSGVEPDGKTQNDVTPGHKSNRGQDTDSGSTSVYITLRYGKGLSKWPPKVQRDPVRIFLESLQSTFESALNLRLDMEMKGNAKHDFAFPRSGMTLDFTQLVVHNKLNNRKIRDLDSDSHSESLDVPVDKTRKKVLVGLMPTVYARFRKRDRGEGWKKDAILISKGCVYTRET